MKQVFLNLFLNALEAMSRGGVLTVKAQEGGAKWVQIEIIDTGHGITANDLERIFDPYFTTKPSGTGLGLAVVQKIMAAHRGEIRLESEPGRGTRAVILLPRT
jgi:two-component system sensor histidine kinase HydH